MKKSYVKKILFSTVLIFVFSSLNTFAFTLPKGISINGTSLSNLNENEAKEVLANEITKIEETKIKIKVDDKELNTTYKELGFKFDKRLELESYIEEYMNSDVVNRFRMQEELKKSGKKYKFSLNLNEDVIRDFLNKMQEEIYSEVADAKITRENNEFIITKEVYGKSLDAKKIFKDFKKKLNLEGKDIEIDANINLVEPKIKEEALKEIDSIIGTYNTNYSTSSESRSTNILVGSSKINGTLLMPGEVFSAYKFMHPFTLPNGYRIAGAYSNGRVIDSVGGGICQVASTLYNAALRAELKITQRNNHSMTVAYVPASADAAIAGTYKDLKFVNNYDRPIYLEAIIEGKNLTFNIWGKEVRDKNREIEFVSEVLSQGSIGVRYIDDPTLNVGEEVKEDAGHAARKSKLWKIVKKDGQIIEKSLVSSDKYNSSSAIIRRGTNTEGTSSLEENSQTSLEE